jgi:hypothetical protein
VKLAFGCGAHLVALAIIGFFVDQQTSAHLPPDLRFFIVVPAALFLTIGLSNFWSLLRGYGQGSASRAAILERARAGEAPQTDGPIVTTGVVRAEGQTLRAPISGVECVAYQYRLYTSQWLPGRRHVESPIYWGYACRPFRIDSPRQAFRVLAVPQLGDAATKQTSSEARERAKSYVATTRYEVKQAMLGIASSVAAMVGSIVTEPSGDVRRDWQAEGVTIPIETLLMEETVVPVGATVSVSGRWSAERRAIVPGELGEGQLGVTLVTGAADRLGREGAAELPSSSLSVAVGGVALVAVGAALVWFSTTGQIADWWRTP